MSGGDLGSGKVDFSNSVTFILIHKRAQLNLEAAVRAGGSCSLTLFSSSANPLSSLAYFSVFKLNKFKFNDLCETMK